MVERVKGSRVKFNNVVYIKGELSRFGYRAFTVHMCSNIFYVRQQHGPLQLWKHLWTCSTGHHQGHSNDYNPATLQRFTFFSCHFSILIIPIFKLVTNKNSCKTFTINSWHLSFCLASYRKMMFLKNVDLSFLIRFTINSDQFPAIFLFVSQPVLGEIKWIKENYSISYGVMLPKSK